MLEVAPAAEGGNSAIGTRDFAVGGHGHVDEHKRQAHKPFSCINVERELHRSILNPGNVTISGSSAKLIKNGIAPLPFPLPALLKKYWYIKRRVRVKVRRHAPFYATLGFGDRDKGAFEDNFLCYLPGSLSPPKISFRCSSTQERTGFCMQKEYKFGTVASWECRERGNDVGVGAQHGAPEADASVCDWIEEIKQAWAKGPASVLELARLVAAGRNALARGEWSALWKAHKLPFGRSKGAMLLGIWKGLSWANVQTSGHLPAGWNILYELAKLDRATLERL